MYTHSDSSHTSPPPCFLCPGRIVAAVLFPLGSGNPAIRRTIAPQSRRVKWLSANLRAYRLLGDIVMVFGLSVCCVLSNAMYAVSCQGGLLWRTQSCVPRRDSSRRKGVGTIAGTEG